MIITLTLNPAFDLHVTLPSFSVGKEHHAQTVTRSIGGKGINTSRALKENGIDNLALILSGRENESEFLKALEAEKLLFKVFSCEGRIRENITVHAETGEETRLSFAGFSCNKAILEQIEKEIPSQATVTFSGSLPQGITESEAITFLLRLKRKGARLVLDSKSLSLASIKEIQPWLIKPNAEEVQTYCNASTIEEIKAATLALHQAGIDNVLVSLGEEGALLASTGTLFYGNAPKIKVRSTIGAGDSMIAGFLADEVPPEGRLKTAIAYGSAACLTEGTAPPSPDDIHALLPQIQIQ